MSTTAAPKSPSEEFKDYCDAEFEHRRNSGANFNEPLYTEAMNLVLGNLNRIEVEGQV